MKTAVMYGKLDLRLEDRPKPVPKDKEVLIRVDYTGVCGSDLHLFQHAICAGGPVVEPMVLGHECAGMVEAVGSGVKNLAVGDRVAVEPGVPCWECENCRNGKYNLCPNVRFYAAPPTYDGCFCEYIVHPEAMCYKLPDSVSTLEGALLEPLSVGVHAVRTSQAAPGMDVVVIGAGCIGLMVMMVLKKYGVSRITMVDVEDKRLRLAKDLGADVIINSREGDYVKEIQTLTNGGADLLFEAAGQQATILQTPWLVRKGGTIMLMGFPKEMQAPLFVNRLINSEITIRTSFRYRHTYPFAIKLVEEGLPLKQIVSNVYSLDDVGTAFDDAIRNKANTTKCVIRVNPDAP